jgi:threonine dehydrogenase-like Zn-dependent dehydrogenase
VVFDATGSGPVLASAVQMARRLGRLVLVGDTPTPSEQPLGPGVVSESIAILGVHGSLFSPETKPVMTDVFFRHVTRGHLNVRSMISDRLSPADAATVYPRLADGQGPLFASYFDWAQPVRHPVG